MHCCVTAPMHLTILGARKHKSPLFQSLEHCSRTLFQAGWRKVEQVWRQQDLGMTVCCVSMVPECSAFLQRIKVLFPALAPVLALLLEHHIIEVFVLCGCLCRSESMHGEGGLFLLLVGRHEFIGSPALTPHKACPYSLFELCSGFLFRSV